MVSIALAHNKCLNPIPIPLLKSHMGNKSCIRRLWLLATIFEQNQIIHETNFQLFCAHACLIHMKLIKELFKRDIHQAQGPIHYWYYHLNLGCLNLSPPPENLGKMANDEECEDRHFGGANKIPRNFINFFHCGFKKWQQYAGNTKRQINTWNTQQNAISGGDEVGGEEGG